MDQQIKEGAIGAVGKYDLEIKDSQLVFIVDAAVSPLTVGVKLALDGPELFDKLKGLIPGQVDDTIFDVLKAAFFKK